MEFHGVDFAFLSEPKVFFHDINNFMQYFNHDYCFSLNSEDKYDLDLPLTRSQAFGGTLVLWKKSLDPFISLHPVTTSAFLPLIFTPPNAPVSIHITLYLPTSGKENEFIEEITLLRIVIEELQEKYPDAPIFLRGDSNVNKNNLGRSKIFHDFASSFNFKKIPTNHNTYHHFIGDGLFDSNIDIIMQSGNDHFSEKIAAILCQDDFPEIDSHHDIILSTLTLPFKSQDKVDDKLITAPKVANNKHKIIWNDENLPSYQAEISNKLQTLRKNWSTPGSSVSVSILLDLSNQVLSEAALSTNKSSSLSKKSDKRPMKLPKELMIARQQQKRAHNALKIATAENIDEAKANFKNIRKNLRCLTRSHSHKADLKRDSNLYSILTQSSSTLFKTIRSSTKPAARTVPFLTVNDKKYPREKVADGLYDSIRTLKMLNKSSLHKSPKYESWSQDYSFILELCRNKRDIPLLSLAQSNKILLRMKPSVRDFWSITPLHYRNAGDEGKLHFNFLLNKVILEINSSSSKELNTVCALLLHKAHGKSRTCDRSYRTISTCPVIAKALDIHIHDLCINLWNDVQAATQYQGEGSSHELASLLVTETIQHSKYNLKDELFMLILDARSAFDTVVTKFLVRNLYLAGMAGNSLLYMDNRLNNRLTYCSWENELMGPIKDELGLEQGGCNSSDAYKIYNNELLETVQKSRQGVDLGNNLVISGVGQADDVLLLSNNIFNLSNILHLTLNYCKDYHVELCADKTKLLHFPSSSNIADVPYNPIQINQQQISLSEKAEHVGVIRSATGNQCHLLNRFAAHKRALGAVLFAGAARNHRGNLAAVVRIEKVYALPVLLSGTASLVLTKTEENMIDQHYTSTLRNLLKTCPGTPRSFVLFMCGSLPASAILHLRQLSLFSMICRLPGDPLHCRAIHALITARPASRSWFTRIRDICLQYCLPHPLTLLQKPLSKVGFKKLAKSMVIDYWEQLLRAEASILPSLKHFDPSFHSLVSPHPIISTPGSKPYEICKSVVQCKMKSGRYKTSLLSRHWSPTNPNGYCPAPICKDTPESLEHLLVHCPYYSVTRNKLFDLWTRHSSTVLASFLLEILQAAPNKLVSFILDPTGHHHVIHLSQVYGLEVINIVCHLTRSWCYAIHKERQKLLKKWKF